MYYIEPYTIGGELYHFGIKGMKWGVRKAPERMGSGGSTQKKKSWSTKKKVAVGLGVAAGLAGTALAAKAGHRAWALKGAKKGAKYAKTLSMPLNKLSGKAKSIKGIASKFKNPGRLASATTGQARIASKARGNAVVFANRADEYGTERVGKGYKRAKIVKGLMIGGAAAGAAGAGAGGASAYNKRRKKKR